MQVTKEDWEAMPFYLRSLHTGRRSVGVTRTQQHLKDETDINKIVARMLNDQPVRVNIRMPVSSDFVDHLSFQDAQNAVIAAKASFMQLDAKVRARFNNDPGAFVEFAVNPDNIEECRKLGLAPPKVEKDSKLRSMVVEVLDEQANRGSGDGKVPGSEAAAGEKPAGKASGVK